MHLSRLVANHYISKRYALYPGRLLKEEEKCVIEIQNRIGIEEETLENLSNVLQNWKISVEY